MSKMGDFPGGPVAKVCTPNADVPDSIPHATTQREDFECHN